MNFFLLMFYIDIYLIGDCGTPSHVIYNGFVTIRPTKEALLAIYSCNTRYALVGNRTITCKPNGKWTETSAVCG